MENLTTSNIKNKDYKAQCFITIVLCIFLGFFGVHRFITQKNGSGLLQLFITPICLGIVLPFLIHNPPITFILLFPSVWWFSDLLRIAAGSWNFEDFVFNK